MEYNLTENMCIAGMKCLFFPVVCSLIPKSCFFDKKNLLILDMTQQMTMKTLHTRTPGTHKQRATAPALIPKTRQSKS